MKHKIVFLDIDGTILTKEQEIPDSSRVAIHTLQKKGIEVILSTGRNISKTLPIAKELSIDSYIANNGSYVSYKGAEVHKHLIPLRTAQMFYNAVKEKQSAAAFFNKFKEHYTDIHHPVFQEAYDVHHGCVDDIVNSAFSELSEIYSMGLFANNEKEIHYYEHHFPSLSFTRWNTHQYCYDIVPESGSKATGIKALLTHLGMNQKEAVAFGDGENDKEMLAYVGTGVAMGNAHPSLIPYSDLQTADVDDEGLYKGLKKIGLLD